MLVSLPVLLFFCARQWSPFLESRDVHSLCHAQDAANVLFYLRLCN